jgi:hypothetical protein
LKKLRIDNAIIIVTLFGKATKKRKKKVDNRMQISKSISFKQLKSSHSYTTPVLCRPAKVFIMG